MIQVENKTHAAEKTLIGCILKLGGTKMSDIAEDIGEKLTVDHFVCYPVSPVVWGDLGATES